MGKTQKKSPKKTPPITGAKTRKNPRQQKATERERGSGPVGRGGKIGKMGGRGRPFYTSSESESDKYDPSAGAKTWKSPMQQKATEHKSGMFSVGRGGKIGKFSTSSESESDEDDESNKEDERHHGRAGMKTSKTTTGEEL